MTFVRALRGLSPFVNNKKRYETKKWCISNNQRVMCEIWIFLRLDMALALELFRLFFALIKYSSQYMNPKIHYLLTPMWWHTIIRSSRAEPTEREKKCEFELKNCKKSGAVMIYGMAWNYIFLAQTLPFSLCWGIMCVCGKLKCNFFYITPHNLFVTYEANFYSFKRSILFVLSWSPVKKRCEKLKEIYLLFAISRAMKIWCFLRGVEFIWK